MNVRLFSFFSLISCFFLSAQVKDSASLISEVSIDAYRKPAQFITSTKSVSVAGSDFLEQNASDRLLESFNLLPGSKMEERSPGSYRLSVRGSTLRSPFGVRNVKVYLDDFTLTDATGNTYLNIIDPEIISQMEIYKGPEGGDFGAATGGTALLKTNSREIKSFGLSGGSYQHFKGKFHYAQNLNNHFFQAYSSYETTDSYRTQAALERKFIFLNDRFTYSEKSQMQMMLLFTDLHYETPGGLTFEQMKADPRQARPGTKTSPGAEEQRAGIYNKTVFTGLSNFFSFDEDFSHFIAVQGSYTDFRNPFITNYEKRYENNFAVRTHLNFEKTFEKSFYQTRLGFEGALSKGIIRNFDNNSGRPADPQNFDDISTKSGFIFLSQKAEYGNRLFIDISGSLNMMNYHWESILPNPEVGARKFRNDFLPGLGISYLLGKGFTVRGKLSKGNSAPTTEEIRSSAQEINTGLNPEYGWNTEFGLRKQWGSLLFTEVSLFDFQLKNAIVRRENISGEEYFVNAGETVQRGIEFIVESRKVNLNSPVFNSVKLYFAGNLYDFQFKDYVKGGADFSGNRLTGVPSVSLQSLVNLEFFNKLQVDLTDFYSSSTPLNDSNTVTDKPSFIGNVSFSYPVKFFRFDADFKLSVQNLYDTSYSLGYDINAFGNRFYNPAAKRNFILGIDVHLK
ncbi:TonB-dependent receptor [Chryseobacterium sp.]|uniref:TonB-dependent receptor n=1 Tax=Chryseobacterium sp. TaxID=1871047 RepID=UPI0011C761F4|nr:TonB-dependent receptor [Chryseobacterium sp.]TXF79577.1 TonB-dependent receptor [Chryseobacterium sp.]